MEQANVSQKTFFSEDNLFMLLNVIHETVNDKGRFDKSNGEHRKLLFEIMTREFRGNTNMSLSELNKWVLKKTFQAAHTEPQVNRQIIDGISYGSSTSSSSHMLSVGQGIRDVDINQRQMPTQFQEYPQQTIVHKDIIISDNSPSNNTLNNAMQNLQNERNADAHDTPDTVDFQSVDTSQMDNSDIMNKLHALEATREHVADPDVNSNANSNGSEIDLVDAMKMFDDKTKLLNDNIQTENSAIQQSKLRRDDIFQESTVFRDQGSDTRGESKTGNAALANQITSDIESMQYTLLENTEVAGTSKLASDVLVNQIALNNKLDDHAFQTSLQLTKEEGALQNHLRQNVAGIQEELLIQPRNQFVNRVNHLEVSSNDRIRTLPTAEYHDTPYYFTVFFNSNRPGFRVFPIYDNHPIEDVVDFTKDSDCQVQLNTMDVRRCAGLRGIPRIDGMVSIDNTLIMGYETVQLSCVGGPNIDSVFYNVVAIETNHVQIYYPYEEAPKYPYIILEIEQFSNVYRSSNALVKKSFCKLFYDRSSTPTLSDSQYHMYTPMNREKKIFQNPLANIDKMTYRLYNSFGNPLDAIPDILHVKLIYFDIDTINTPPKLNQSYINIVLQNYIPQENISVNNHITFEKCIEWYNKDWFQSWYESISSLIDAQNNLEEDYFDALLENKGADKETRQKLKEDFARKQIKFEYPTAGYVNGGSHPSFLALQEYLHRDIGHVVNRIGRYNGTTFSEWSTLAENEQRYINAISIPIKTSVDTFTGTETIYTFGDDNNALNGLLNSSEYPLMTCTMLNNSVCTNISMSIYTQEEENVIVSHNI